MIPETSVDSTRGDVDHSVMLDVRSMLGSRCHRELSVSDGVTAHRRADLLEVDLLESASGGRTCAWTG